MYFLKSFFVLFIMFFLVISNERFLDLPSGLNSFRRLVAHRLADRFSLLKEQITIEVSLATAMDFRKVPTF